MGRQETERQIGEHLFRVEELDPFKGFDLIADLKDILAPAISGAAATALNKFGESASVLDVDTKDLDVAAVLREVLRAVTKPKLNELRRLMMEVTWVRTKNLDTDTGEYKLTRLSDKVFAALFRGKWMDMMRWFEFALEVQLRPFLGDLTEWLSEVMGSLGLQFRNTSSEPGPSGELSPTSE